MLDLYGSLMGFYMGPVWAAHMGVMWVLQQGSMLGPHGCSIWVQYGLHFGPYIEFPIVPVTHHIEYNRFGAVASFSSLTMISLQERCQMWSIAQL